MNIHYVTIHVPLVSVDTRVHWIQSIQRTVLLYSEVVKHMHLQNDREIPNQGFMSVYSVCVCVVSVTWWGCNCASRFLRSVLAQCHMVFALMSLSLSITHTCTHTQLCFRHLGGH